MDLVEQKHMREKGGKSSSTSNARNRRKGNAKIV